jgi:hypothetical protein
MPDTMLNASVANAGRGVSAKLESIEKQLSDLNKTMKSIEKSLKEIAKRA